MMVNIIMFCLIGAVFANPISFSSILESNELDSNSTESLSVSQSSENGTSELQSSEEDSSNQSPSSESDSDSDSESESTESTSEDTTSEESNGLSAEDEDDVADPMAETRDNAEGSEENVRKSWLQVFASVIQILSAEDNSSAKVKGQSDHLTEKQPTHTFTGTTFRQGAITNLPLVENPINSNDTASDSADTTEAIDSNESTSSESKETSKPSDSSDSTSSESKETSKPSDSTSSDSSDSTSSESNETSETSDASKSAEESNASDSAELVQIKTRDCVNGTRSCESDEYLFQDIGDDAHYSVDSVMMPDENERELILRR